MANLAVIGFEFSHMVPAFRKGLGHLALDGLTATPVIWSARDGLKQEVLNNFPFCHFLDGGKGWHGEYQMSVSEYDQAVVPLNCLEIKHFSYTHSRNYFFRDPARTKKEDIGLYTDVLRFCYMLLEKKNVALCFFSDFPHNLLDLGMLYAARRLGVASLINDGPYIDDYNFPVMIPHVVPPVGSYPLSNEFILSLKGELKNRDLTETLAEPDYIKNPNKTLPSIPFQVNLSFHKHIVQKIYKYSNSRFLALISSKGIRWLMKTLSVGYSSYIARKFASKSLTLRNSYILVLLHYHPERTTSTMALDTPFEEDRIISLASRFPDTTILVREHPKNLRSPELMQYRSLGAIKKITSCSNVRYIFPSDRDSYRSLIARSLFTISTSGTVALESIQLGVPTVHMSHSFAEGLPGVIVVDRVEEIKLAQIMDVTRNLQLLKKEDLITLCKSALSRRPMNRGFICGYHSNIYSNDEYVKGAAGIIYASLHYAAKGTPESFAKCSVPRPRLNI